MSRPHVAERYAECPLCFKPLHLGPVGVFLDASGKRVGGFYRLQAARAFLESGDDRRCPVTGQPIASVKEVPSILEDPKTWFRVCDVDRDRRLSRDEVISALKAQLPLDNDAIERFRTDDSAWRTWDTDGLCCTRSSVVFAENCKSSQFHHCKGVCTKQTKQPNLSSLIELPQEWLH